MNQPVSTAEPDAAIAGLVHQLITECSGSNVCAAEILVDRHPADAVAFTIIEADGEQLRSAELTYGELADQSKRLATALAAQGVGRGSTVGVLMGKRAELVIACAAIARLGAVYLPLFTAFAAPAIEMRLTAAQCRLVITEPGQVDKIAGIDGVTAVVAGEQFDALVSGSSPLQQSVAVGGEAPLVLLFTSGTTGAPKGVPIPVRALAAFSAYLTFGLDVRDDDVYWNAADPGWAYGLYYGILAPLATGRPNLLLRAGFSAETTVRVLEQFAVTNFAAAPTVYRALRQLPAAAGFGLRCTSSAGEPLTPEVNEWSQQALGVEVRDHYGQTELGMVINNHWFDGLRRPLVPGSMGVPMPGFNAGIVEGQIAIDVADSPLMWFTGYLDDADKTAARFTGDRRWYLTGDAGRVDEEGQFFFSARDDDVIIMAGYRIGPFDIESVMITHRSVVEVAVVGRPDELRGEVIEAFVVLAAGENGTEALQKELQQLVKTGFAAHAYPRTVHFVDELPKTPSGKVQRYLLRQR